MNLKFGQYLLRLFSPSAEKARMDMRHARCHAEAVSEDLNRTLTIHGDRIVKMLREARKEKSDDRT